MAFLIRLLAIDIDGTLTFKDRKLDVLGLQAVRKAESSGISVVLATGNIFRYAEATSNLIGTSGPWVAEDGGVVYDPVGGQLYLLGDRADVDRGLAALKTVFGELKHTRSSSDRLTGATIEKNISLKEVRKIIQQEGLPIVAVDSGYAIHLRSPEVNKGNALKKVSKLTKVPLSDIAAIGDGLNDVEMLQIVGASFAVANSVEDAKQVSRFVTNSPFGRGVAEAVEKIINYSYRDLQLSP